MKKIRRKLLGALLVPAAYFGRSKAATVDQAEGTNEKPGLTFADRKVEPFLGADLGSIKFTQSGVGAVPSNVLEKLRRIIIEPEDFGAVGDGVVDDFQALQFALQQAGKITGGVVRGRAGKIYRYTKSLVIPASCTLSGEGYLSDPPSEKSSHGTIYLKDGNFNGITLSECSSLSNCSLVGAPGNKGDGVCQIGTRSSVNNVSMFYHGRDNYRIGSDSSSDNTNMWRGVNIISYGAGRNGIFVDHQSKDPLHPDVNCGLLMGADCRQSRSGAGLKLGRCSDNTIIQVSAQFNGTGILLDKYAKGNVIVSYYVEGNLDKNFSLSDGAIRNSVLSTTNGATSSDVLSDAGSDNYVIGRDSKTGFPYLKSPMIFKEIDLNSSSGAGYMSFSSNGERKFNLELKQTDADAVLSIRSAGKGRLRLRLGEGATVSEVLRHDIFIEAMVISPFASQEKLLNLAGVNDSMSFYIIPKFKPPEGVVWNAFIDDQQKAKVRISNITNSEISLKGGVWRIEGVAA
ncbi:hypothetical protein [Pigmentiphaga sp. CHJ604]|uniref:hypothetical protein n=1 Tax=Pigmentiphaga sp. CHJ604 TaxID=3081984 RepID=UPI0030D486B2